MTEPVTPPLFDEAPQRLCTRWLGDRNCGVLPVMHVLWDAESMENGMVCEEHVKELGSRWAFAQAHELGPDCGMPNSLWFFDENVCRCEDGFEEPELVASANVRRSLPDFATKDGSGAGSRDGET